MPGICGRRWQMVWALVEISGISMTYPDKILRMPVPEYQWKFPADIRPGLSCRGTKTLPNKAVSAACIRMDWDQRVLAFNEGGCVGSQQVAMSTGEINEHAMETLRMGDTFTQLLSVSDPTISARCSVVQLPRTRNHLSRLRENTFRSLEDRLVRCQHIFGAQRCC